MVNFCRLGINIDHVATLRNARGGKHPEILRAMQIVQDAGADSITVHLREDRRHINDIDLIELKKNAEIPINLEIAPTQEMVEIALNIKPDSICFVPERREEITTEGGLNVKILSNRLEAFNEMLTNADIKVACFIEPHLNQIDILNEIGIKIIEIHTGKYASADNVSEIDYHLNEIQIATIHAKKVGFDCHAGHGLNFTNVKKIASIIEIEELNIGHFIIGESIFLGLREAIIRMKKLIYDVRI